MSLKRLAVLAVFCLGLLWAGSEYASTACADLSDRYSWAAPDARKDPRSACKSRQEAGRRPPYHSSSLHLERKEQ
jgi:hypothetical protein